MMIVSGIIVLCLANDSNSVADGCIDGGLDGLELDCAFILLHLNFLKFWFRIQVCFGGPVLGIHVLYERFLIDIF